ncbi:phage tail protein [Sulfurospirillum cavolei]|uniref:phage tail protein n=1 Tax=Sulfurospirillum cavolei TaxID=366522 RepID=UPI000764B768|nr:phage tail protein [Sulfurospirillum cavolei]
MTNIMAMIGDFIFSLEKKPFDALSHTKEYSFAEIPKVNYYTGEQSVGKDIEELTLSGSIITLKGGLNPLARLFAIADQKQAVPFIYGYGEVLGDFKITKVKEDRSLFLPDGRSVKVVFSVEMKRVRE